MGQGALGGAGTVSNLGEVDLSGRQRVCHKSRDAEVTFVPAELRGQHVSHPGIQLESQLCQFPAR